MADTYKLSKTGAEIDKMLGSVDVAISGSGDNKTTTITSVEHNLIISGDVPEEGEGGDITIRTDHAGAIHFNSTDASTIDMTFYGISVSGPAFDVNTGGAHITSGEYMDVACGGYINVSCGGNVSLSAPDGIIISSENNNISLIGPALTFNGREVLTGDDETLNTMQRRLDNLESACNGNLYTATTANYTTGEVYPENFLPWGKITRIGGKTVSDGGLLHPSVVCKYAAGSETHEIPENILNIDGYGNGIDSTHYNYLDLTNRRFVKTIYKRPLYGLSWKETSKYPGAFSVTVQASRFPGIIPPASSSELPIILADGYSPTIWNNRFTDDNSISLSRPGNTVIIAIMNTSYSGNLEGFVSSLSNKYLYYVGTTVSTSVELPVNADMKVGEYYALLSEEGVPIDVPSTIAGYQKI